MFTKLNLQWRRREGATTPLSLPFWIVVLATFFGATGCQTLSLPAIDTTGNRLFDFNRPLQFVNPHDPNNGYPSTAPAYQHPPTPPKCTQTGEKKLCQGCLSGKGCLFGKRAAAQAAEEERGRCGELLITPNRLVAPVGGEVIVLAGVCGKDGSLVTGEAIEWMLAPESVGQIVEVGDDAKGQRQSFWKTTSTGPKVEKLGVDYARGRTSREPGVITKGTADQSDDLPIRKGQTWVSLTSPSEGVSKVTVLAPDSDVWDKRRQTATIYWIDASWDFPQPQVVNTDAPVPIATKVLRSDNFIPATDWIVRYRSLNPEFARFVSQGNDPSRPPGELMDMIESRVDANGMAQVYLRRLDNLQTGLSVPKSGTAMIEVEIIRPAQVSENMPELPLARATTSVTWNAPELVLDAMGPDRAAPGQPIQYLVKVSNIGGLPAENVIVTATIPVGMNVDFTSYNPSRRSNQALIWDQIGSLGPRNTFEVAIQVTPTSAGDARIIFDLQASPNIKQQKTVPTLVEGASVTLQFAPKPNQSQVSVGSFALFDCVVTNQGSQAISNLQIQLESTPGLFHAESGDTRVAHSLSVLAPGQSVALEPRFVVQREGDLGIRASAQSMGQTLATASTSVRGVANVAPPSSGPSTTPPPTGGILPGSPPVGSFPGGNLPGGNLPNSNLPGGSFPGGGTPPPSTMPPPGPPNVMPPIPGGSNPPNGALPTMPPLPPLSGMPGSSARPEIGSGVANDGNLAISVQPLVQQIRRGEIISYELKVSNLLPQPDQKVAISFTIPAGAKLISVQAPGLDHRLSDSKDVVELTPIQYFRPRDSFSVMLQLRHDTTDSQSITASVKSRNQPSGVSATIRVLPR